MDAFLKDALGQVLTGQVWPLDSVFLDFFDEQARQVWKSQIDHFFETINFDGLWLDMNEATNYCTAVCYYDQRAPSPVRKRLSYIPTERNLETKSLSLDATHKNGWLQLDTHSLYGTSEVMATNEWFTYKKKRPMIIERSGYSGVGKYGSKWLGDNYSTIDYLRYSVTGTMLSNVMGIPLTGADICGFNGNTTAELCARWYMIGAFYPFSRNHNHRESISQDPN